jgi:hypothetical protein
MVVQSLLKKCLLGVNDGEMLLGAHCGTIQPQEAQGTLPKHDN